MTIIKNTTIYILLSVAILTYIKYLFPWISISVGMFVIVFSVLTAIALALRFLHSFFRSARNENDSDASS